MNLPIVVYDSSVQLTLYSHLMTYLPSRWPQFKFVVLTPSKFHSTCTRAIFTEETNWKFLLRTWVTQTGINSWQRQRWKKDKVPNIENWQSYLLTSFWWWWDRQVKNGPIKNIIFIIERLPRPPIHQSQ